MLFLGRVFRVSPRRTLAQISGSQGPSAGLSRGGKSNILQQLSVLADAGSVRTASGLEPINLQILRRTQVMPFSFLVLSAAALWIAVLASSGSVRSELLGVAVTLTVYAFIAAIALMVAGEERRGLRLDEEGITVRGDRIPWEAVMSARWAFDAAGTRPRGGIELLLRDVGAYQPPRSGRVSIAPAAFHIAPNVLLDMIVRYARPRTVYVLPPRRRPFGRNET